MGQLELDIEGAIFVADLLEDEAPLRSRHSENFHLLSHS